MLRPTRGAVPGSVFRFAYGAFTLFDRLSQHRSATENVCNFPIPLRQVPDCPLNPRRATPAGLTRNRFRLHPFRSPLLRASLRFLLLRLLRCFTSPGDRLLRGDWALHPAGFPHSDICGSTVACTSPQLFAACHVLLRPQAPRHSPCALNTLTPNTSSFCFFRSLSTVKVLMGFSIPHKRRKERVQAIHHIPAAVPLFRGTP